MSRSRLLSSLVLPLFSALLTGQDCIYNIDSCPCPGQSSSSQPIPPDMFPFFRADANEQRLQVLVSRWHFQGAPVTITDLRVAPTDQGTVTFSHLVIRMGHLASDVVGNSFAANAADGLTTVLDVRDYVWGTVAGQWRGIGLAQGFRYVPARGNLLIDVTCRSQSGTRTIQFHQGLTGTSWLCADYPPSQPATAGGRPVPYGPKISLCIERADVSLFGRGCAGTRTSPPGLGFVGSARLGQGTRIVLSNAQPQSIALLAFGSTLSPPFPLLPSPTGMPGCRLYHNLDFTVGLAADGSGTGQVPLNVPADPGLVGACLFTQFVVVDPPANPFGLLTTNAGRLMLGY